MNETIFFVAGGIVLLAIGIGLGFWIARLRSGKEAARAEDIQKQFDDYRHDVSQHFGRTAEHFQAIGQQYRELYEHMASGADALLNQQAMDEKLSFKPVAAIEALTEDTAAVKASTSKPRDDTDGNGSGDNKESAAETASVDKTRAAEPERAATASTDESAGDVAPEATNDGGDDADRIYH